MAETGRILAAIVQKISQIGRNWSKLVENGRKWLTITKRLQKCAENENSPQMPESGRTVTAIVPKMGQNWSKMGLKWPKLVAFWP